VIFNENLGRIAQQYLRKGAKVYLEGQLQTRKWTDKDNIERYSTEVVIPRFRGELTMLEGRSGAGAGGGMGGGDDYGDDEPAPRPAARAASGGGRSYSPPMNDMDDEIPF